jgi:hypothetical protein
MKKNELNCLTDLWIAAGSPPAMRPDRWMNGKGREYIEHLKAKGKGRVIEKDGKIWGDRYPTLSFVTDLSPDISRLVYQTFFDYMDGKISAFDPHTEAQLDQSHAGVSPEMMRAVTQLLRG